MPCDMEGSSYTLWACAVGVSCNIYACSFPVAFGRSPLCMVLLVSGTPHSPDSSITPLMIGGAKKLI